MLVTLLLSTALLGLAQAKATLIDFNTDAAKGEALLSTKYEYIIVGGGAAGLTVASRLAQASKKNKVLVIEAGGSGVGDPAVTIPSNSFSFIFTDNDWKFSIAPQEHAAGQEINLSQGKVLGGGTAVNGLVWTRGAKEEFDAWETLGSKGWNWKSLYPFMKKSEKLNYPSSSLTEEYGVAVGASSLGSSGPVDVSFPAYIPIQHQKLVEAAVELGHPYNTDAYGGKNAGVHFSLSSQTTQPVRETSEFAYLDSLTSNPITTFTHATVSKVNFVGSGSLQRATGVNFLGPDGKQYTAQVAKAGEVILSAGVVRTPQILELSGIGKPEVLSAVGINTLINLPGVGQNYEDHTLTLLTYELKPEFPSFDALKYNSTLLAEQTALLASGQGWLTFAQGVTDFEPIQNILTAAELKQAKKLLATKPPSVPQDQFDIIKKQILAGTPQIEFLLFNSFSAGTGKKDNTSYVSLAVTHLHPLSRGSIHIKSANINDHPIINPNFLESEWDKWILAKASAYGRKLLQTQAFQEVLLPEEVHPGAAVQTEEQWTQFVKEGVNSGYHSIGSASLLPKNKGGVVNKDLRVYGTTNLRIADLSAMPLHVSAHTQPQAYLFGEKLADILLNQ